MSPIFQGYEVVRRLVKNGPSYPKTARDNLLQKNTTTTTRTPGLSSSETIVKLPFGRGKLVEGRVWDKGSQRYVSLNAWGSEGENSLRSIQRLRRGGHEGGKKAVGQPQNQVCDQFVVALEWGRDGTPDPKAPKVDKADRYKSGLAHVHPRDVMFTFRRL